MGVETGQVSGQVSTPTPTPPQPAGGGNAPNCRVQKAPFDNSSQQAHAGGVALSAAALISRLRILPEGVRGSGVGLRLM